MAPATPESRLRRNGIFNSTFWIADNLRNFGKGKSIIKTNNEFKAATFFKNEDNGLFHISKEDVENLDASSLINFLKKHPNFILEFETIFRCFHENDTSYQKAIHCLHKNNLINIYEIVIEHPGMSIEGIGGVLGKFYRVRDERFLEEVDTPESCPCNNKPRHDHHLVTLIAFTKYLEEGVYNLVHSGRNFVVKGS